MSDDARVLRVDGLRNARDLGGLERDGGGQTPRGVFYRSESIDRIPESGWDQLHENGIRTVVDLRTPTERARDTTARPDWLTTLVVDLDAPDRNRDFWPFYEDTGLDGTPLVLQPHLAAMPGQTAAALSALADAPPGGVLVHCMGGRDRTGLVALILLGIAGVSRSVIADDYLRTAAAGGEFELTATADGQTLTVADLLARHGTTPRRAILEAIDGIDPGTVPDRLDLPSSVRRALVTWRGRLEV